MSSMEIKMENVPEAPMKATLVDLLDRVLDKGLVIEADVVILVAGVPLLGVKLRAALAGMSTMCEYGMLADWDQRIRSRQLARKRPGNREEALHA